MARYGIDDFPTAVRFAAGLFMALLAGCAVGPDYKRPEATATMPPTYAGATNEWKVAEPQAHLPKRDWWKVFGDAELNRLEADAATANQELKAAVAGFDQARALADVARSGLFPHIGLSASATRQGDSLNRPINGKRAGTGQTATYNDFQVPLEVRCATPPARWCRARR